VKIFVRYRKNKGFCGRAETPTPPRRSSIGLPGAGKSLILPVNRIVWLRERIFFNAISALLFLQCQYVGVYAPYTKNIFLDRYIIIWLFWYFLIDGYIVKGFENAEKSGNIKLIFDKKDTAKVEAAVGLQDAKKSENAMAAAQ
jgi:hypothetical protein